MKFREQLCQYCRVMQPLEYDAAEALSKGCDFHCNTENLHNIVVNQATGLEVNLYFLWSILKDELVASIISLLHPSDVPTSRVLWHSDKQTELEEQFESEV